MSDQPANRDETGKFAPGVSGNPQGRPKNPLAAIIREETDNGREIVDKVLAILRNSTKNGEILDAAIFLRDTGWHKPITPTRNVDDDGNTLVPPVVFLGFDKSDASPGQGH